MQTSYLHICLLPFRRDTLAFQSNNNDNNGCLSDWLAEAAALQRPSTDSISGLAVLPFNLTNCRRQNKVK